MKIERSTVKNGSVLPAAFGVLSSIPEEHLKHELWPLRHPRMLYLLSVQKVRDALERMLDAWERERSAFHSTEKLTDAAGLMRTQRDLLYALREHVDDCYSILLAFTEPSAEKSEAERRPERHLKAAGIPSLRRFEGVVTDYLVDYLAPIVNGLKHRGGYLHQIVLYESGEPNTARLGYYLEEAWEGQATGPSWRVHHDGNSGFSFSRDLRLHLYYVYELSERLSEVILATFRVKHRYDVVPRRAEDRGDKWLNVVRRLVSLPYEPFVNELRWPTPLVELTKTEGTGAILVVAYPVKQLHSWKVRELRVQVGSSGGRAFKVPYWGKPKRSRG